MAKIINLDAHCSECIHYEPCPNFKCIVRLCKSVSQQEKHLVIVNHINHLLKKKRNEITDY